MNLRKEIRKVLREEKDMKSLGPYIQKIKQLIPDAVIRPSYCEYTESTIVTGPIVTINLDTNEVSSEDYGEMRYAKGGLKLSRKIKSAFPDNEVEVEFSESGMQQARKATIDIYIKPKGYEKKRNAHVRKMGY